MDAQRFAESFRAARLASGLTTTAVAEMARKDGFRWHQQIVSRIERGDRELRAAEFAWAVVNIGMEPLGLATEQYVELEDMRRKLDTIRGLVDLIGWELDPRGEVA